MLNKIAIALGLLFGSFLVAWGQSSTLSNLSPTTAIGITDLFYDVQTPGIGGVKVTGAQFLSFVFGNVSGNCSANAIGQFSCVGGNSTQIAAGTNIATSGTGNNVTVSTILTPTFSTITTTLASITGWLTAAGVNMQTVTVAGNLTATTAAFNGFLTATGANLNTATIVSLGATTQCVESIAGVLTGTGSTCGTGQFSINAGTNIVTSGTANNITVSTTLTPTFTSLTSTNGSITTLTGGTATFQTVTINGMTPTGPNCLQETGGVVQATNASCGSGAAGANTDVQFNNNSAFGGDGGFIYGSASGQVGVKSAGGYGLSSLTSATTKTIDTMLYRDGAVSVLALGDFATNTNPTAFHVYNTTDNVSTNIAPTNFERGTFDWTTTPNTLTIGVQKGGSGTFRDMQIIGNSGGNITIQGVNGNISMTSGGNQTFFNSQAIMGGNIELILSGTHDASFHRAAPSVVDVGDGGANANGWINWAGEVRLSTDFGSTTTTLAAVTATTVTLQSGRNYSFHAFLPFSTGASAGGIKAAFGGGATATNFVADGICSDGASGITVTRVSALTSAFVANTNTTTTPKCEIDGTFEVNVGGSFSLLFAQNVLTGASTVTRGAYMLVHDIP